ncbi:hypothetical protein M9458_051040, partial [Cirrhinus mrigala]
PSGEIVEGDSVILNCSSDSNPPAEISWFKGRMFVRSGRVYSISKISSDHSGEYKCNSDSNPPALNFSWFKEDESSAVGSGQSFSALQSGRFYCEAHNQHGSQRSDAVTVTVKGRASHLLI